MDNASPTATDPAQPSGGEQPSTGPRVSRDEMLDLGRLRRSVTDRHIAGVAGGIARHLDVDAIIVRVALVVGVFFGGAGLLLYIGAWLLVPEEGTDDEPLGLDRRSRSLAIAGVGVVALLSAVGDWAGAHWFPWQLAIVAVVVLLFLRRKDRRSRPTSGYGSTETSYAPPVEPQHWETYARAPRPRNPRKRGPKLFLFTLALIALAEGVLGIIDLAGFRVDESAYSALALAITAVMLVVGSFWGRAGGLIALGLVAAIATAGSTIGTTIGEDARYYAPASAAAVQDTYEFGAGRFTLDLSDVSDVEALDGRDISIDGVGGQIEVIVPEGIDVDVKAQALGGDIRAFDQRDDGFDVTVDAFRDGGAGAPDMTINIDVVGGEITVREAA